MFRARMSIHCSTREEAEGLMQLLAAEGILWNGGQSPLELAPFRSETGTWYSIHENKNVRNPFGDAASELVITYCNGDCFYKDYQQIEYAELVGDITVTQNILSIDDFI